jgi:hypothetical protein
MMPSETPPNRGSRIGRRQPIPPAPSGRGSRRGRGGRPANGTSSVRSLRDPPTSIAIHAVSE